MSQVGRNDPCPCGSGKKYKACCMKDHLPQGKKKFKASVLNKSVPNQQFDLMDRTFGSTIANANKPYVPPKKEEDKQE